MSTAAQPHPSYPRPQLVRERWISCNGPWQFALDPEARWSTPAAVSWQTTITVPFAPETPLSGVGDTSFFRACWYQRSLALPSPAPDERLILHFGAIDYAATVWVNGLNVAAHVGGYTPFAVDITDYLHEQAAQTISVRVEDDPHDLAKPRGKQDWLLHPHSIWYPRTTGIWQTVWLEYRPAIWIKDLRWTPYTEQWTIGLHACIGGSDRSDLRLRVKLHVGNLLLADDTYSIVAGEVSRRIMLSDPGIDDYRNELLWSPPSPTLIEAELQLWGRRGELLDTVHSYTALRSLTTDGDRVLLNGRPYRLRLVLDQGYWSESGLTAPSDAALRRDVELAKAMGFNGVRKHQKIEAPRFLYWADRLGLLVWEEMPSAYRFTADSTERLTSEWIAVLKRDYSHPCIVAWVPFNESWGVPDLPTSPAQRNYVQALYHLTKTLDPTRLVLGNDGWESVATDLIGIHDYDDDPARMLRRYGDEENLPRIFARERPGGRILTLQQHPHSGQPMILTEFGGIAFSANSAETWGYSRQSDAQAFADAYTRLLDVVRSLTIFAGFCYTQFSDTYQEANGLLYADRTPKIPLDVLAQATRGARPTGEEHLAHEWAERMRRFRHEQAVSDSSARLDPAPLAELE